MQLRNIKNQIKQKIEEAQLNMDSSEIVKMGIDENADIQSQIVENMGTF
jgi:anti-sigma28 factor (negative regulator of flagellin synthesis)